MMTCGRAVAILRGLEPGHEWPGMQSLGDLAAQAKEIDELIAAGAVLEADPDVVHMLSRIHGLSVTVPKLDDAMSVFSLRNALAEIETKLKDEWYRIRASKEDLRAQEQARVALRYAIGQLSDPIVGASLAKLHKDRALLAEGAAYVACPSLGYELYAVTHRGLRIKRELELRLARFEPVGFSVFLKVFDKTYAKMDKFVQDLTAISQGVPPVRKHRGQVLVGLVKSGLPVQNAVGTYREVLHHNLPPDVAVMCARNVGKYGNAANTMGALQRAHQALLQAGLPNSQDLTGAAKALLAYDPPESGVPRFVELLHGLRPLFPQGAFHLYKHVARLMPAEGTMPAVVCRVGVALQIIRSQRDLAYVDVDKVAVALASMVKSEDVLPGLVHRFFQLRALLRQEAGNNLAVAADYALECVVCPGTPEEVASLVRSLARRVAEERAQPIDARDALVIAVAFAKRFAY